MSYLKDADYNLYFRPGAEAFGYSEGEEAERRLLDIVLSVQDRSTFSNEWLDKIVDWSTRYHFSRARHCLLRPLDIKPGERVLELGCGTGAITRYLGEAGAEITAVEGSLARARVAAARCQDLPNVTVIADDLQAADVEGQYDWVTLIGVLEYAGAYSKARDPYQAYLASAMRHLKPGGRVVIAIENQLGLKYFNGCSEDHLGSLFSGIQDLYQPTGGVRTFGRKALSEVLSRAGLSQQRWMYPFPDYKVPNIVLSDAALAHPEFNAVDLLLRSFSEDYSGNMLRFFDEAMVNRVLADNGLLGDFSNSFLVVAERPAVTPDAAWQQAALAWTYAVHRQPGFCTETVFVPQSDQRIRVGKRRLIPSAEAAVPFGEAAAIKLDPQDSDYVPGRQQAWDIVRAHVQHGDVQTVVQAFKPWAQAMLAHAELGRSPLSMLEDSVSAFPIGAGEPSEAHSSATVPVQGQERGARALRHWVLPGALVDHAPFNLLLDAGGGTHLIDQEWQISCPVPAGWVLLRGVLHTLQVGLAPKDGLGSLARVVIALADACGYDVSQDDVKVWLLLETMFSSSLAPRRAEHRLSDATQLPVTLAVESLSQMRAEVSGLQHELAQLREQLARSEAQVAAQSRENIENLTRIDQYQTRIRGLEDELKTVFASRSWRWSGWLRNVRRRSRL